MAALSARRRGFVISLFALAGNATGAARAVGYAPGSAVSQRVRAHRLLHSRPIQEAVQEHARALFVANAPSLTKTLLELAFGADTPPEVRRKSAVDLLNRAGLSAIVHSTSEHKLTVEHPGDEAVAIERLWQKMVNLGLDPVPILGARRAALMMPVVTEAEYAEGLPASSITDVEIEEEEARR